MADEEWDDEEGGKEMTGSSAKTEPSRDGEREELRGACRGKENECEDEEGRRKADG
jgi:hypothetical protein